MRQLIIALGLVTSSFSAQAQALPSREEIHAAFEACIEETGVQPPQRGQRPNPEDREKMDECLADKGIELPPRPPRGEGPRFGHRPQMDDSDSDTAR